MTHVVLTYLVYRHVIDGPCALLFMKSLSTHGSESVHFCDNVFSCE